MFRSRAFLLLCGLGLALTAGVAAAAPNFIFKPGEGAPDNFQKRFQGCIKQFNAAGGLSRQIIRGLDGVPITVIYQNGGAGVPNPTPGGDPTGKPLELYWDSAIKGVYDDDGAPKDPCASLLHELEHAGRYFSGEECTGEVDLNEESYKYDEALGARAENFWLEHENLTQRTAYDFFGKPLKLGRWTRWPASDDAPVPKAPKCERSCPTDDFGVASAAACRRCTMFHQKGCVDFTGGIYSGGDHRSVATGNLKIVVGDRGYCQGRPSCEFRNQYVAPHLHTAFPKGVTSTAIATPGEGSKFARWGPGVCAGQGPTCTFTAERPSCISAQFLLLKPTAPPQSLPDVPCPQDP
jgi:hypothetical protein